MKTSHTEWFFDFTYWKPSGSIVIVFFGYLNHFLPSRSTILSIPPSPIQLSVCQANLGLRPRTLRSVGTYTSVWLDTKRRREWSSVKWPTVRPSLVRNRPYRKFCTNCDSNYDRRAFPMISECRIKERGSPRHGRVAEKPLDVISRSHVTCPDTLGPSVSFLPSEGPRVRGRSGNVKGLGGLAFSLGPLPTRGHPDRPPEPILRLRSRCRQAQVLGAGLSRIPRLHFPDRIFPPSL